MEAGVQPLLQIDPQGFKGGHVKYYQEATSVHDDTVGRRQRLRPSTLGCRVSRASKGSEQTLPAAQWKILKSLLLLVSITKMALTSKALKLALLAVVAIGSSTASLSSTRCFRDPLRTASLISSLSLDLGGRVTTLSMDTFTYWMFRKITRSICLGAQRTQMCSRPSLLRTTMRNQHSALTMSSSWR